MGFNPKGDTVSSQFSAGVFGWSAARLRNIPG